MKLKDEITKILKNFTKEETIFDSAAGIYNYKYILEMIGTHCILTSDEKHEITTLINNFDVDDIDFDCIISPITEFEWLVNIELPDCYYIEFNENGDYGIWYVPEDE